jgi:hypothetical protein
MAKKRHPTSKSPRRPGAPAGRLEWVGGLVVPPFFVQDPNEPFRPEMAVWIELPTRVVLINEVLHPRDRDGAVVRGLLEAMEQPMTGPPRRPHAIRVADASLAGEIRQVVGVTLPVVVAPTPELDELLQQMIETMPGGVAEPSYLENGRLSPSMLRELFTAAKLLYGLAPWKVASDEQVLRMDIPTLDVDGACVSIIGNLGESEGLILFPSLTGYEAFVQASESLHPGTRRVDFGTDWLALTFDPADELPKSMLREIAEHDWPVAGESAYPRLERRDPDGASRPLVERDLKIATTCAFSLCTFFMKHRGLFEDEAVEPVCESYFDSDDLEVRFTAPYEAFSFFDVSGPRDNAAKPFRPKVGRNAPCPCGSGRKYKKCHLPLDEREHTAGGAPHAQHELDARLVRELFDYAERRFGGEWRRFEKQFDDAREAVELARSWAVYGFAVQGRTVLEWYLEGPGHRASRAERAWLEAQRAAWLSVWEVLDVEPGESVTLRDLLTDERRCVREASASRIAVVRDVLLGRVVDCDGVSLLCGVHPRLLSPAEAAEVVRRARGRLRRKRAVPPDRLRDPAIGRYLIRRWEEAVAARSARPAVPSELRNTDGDPLLVTVDHFNVVPDARSAVAVNLATLEGAEGPAQGDDPGIFDFLRMAGKGTGPSETLLVGRAVLSDTSLRLETNSCRRADTLRKRVETVCGDRILFKIREHVDPLSPAAQSEARKRAPKPMPPEAKRFVQDYKRRHYASWIDEPLPALRGKTPREAMRTESGREAVDQLLKGMEHREQRLPRAEAFDFTELRGELGLD